ncbi:NAD(P)-dependent oxidoreductase [Roseovarius sp. SCSIO 43702]|uniref:NAD(P)-dependent oxidoreductase n=1 Tax=Roseovarius sp. SCSIO 43702 TaxID=2823043 RepID=UPI001C735EC2|nr:NAD(P)-dependent oxidoreductase [Roseovarius sp. SCSIO 43702]QYX56312.1 NAD(P)-dependent oxidoreductase [Roseovarius sp. SCSIO 43702]
MSGSDDRIGLVGLGAMGAGMGGNLLAGTGELHICANRTRTVADHLVAHGATEHPDPQALASACDVILLCLPDSHTVETVIDAMRPALTPGMAVVDTGTSSLASLVALENTLSAQGVAFAESPLTGGAAQAQEGTLGALVGAAPDVFGRIEPILGHFCGTVQHFGPVGAGTRAKFANNYMVMGIIALVIEAFHMADLNGTDPAKLYDVVTRGSADSGALRRIIGNALEGDYRGYRFSVGNAAKDMRYIMEMMDDLNRDTTLAKAVQAFFEDATRADLSDRLVSELMDPGIRARLFGG